ncbi:hypothetical protein GCM10008937_14300 [Deinococcus depolymerans]|uniref:Uncharacterized protein n=1 Tax=Deinococcus depolymerans TaxID=392408 RepID=A0ABN1BXZ9_9DEIO
MHVTVQQDAVNARFAVGVFENVRGEELGGGLIVAACRVNRDKTGAYQQFGSAVRFRTSLFFQILVPFFTSSAE